MRNLSRGRELARELLGRTQHQATVVEQRLRRAPTLAIVAASDDASRRFVQIKQDMLAGFPLRVEAVWLGPEATSDHALRCVARLNARPDVEAIFIQFPLPGSLDAQLIADAVAIRKDVDCSGARAEAIFLAAASDLEPVAPRAAFDLLVDQLTSCEGRQVVIIGGDDPFTRGLDTILRKSEALVTRIAGNDLSAGAVMNDADAVVLTETLPDARLLDGIEGLAVLLDAGYYLPPRPADWIPARACSTIATHLTQYGNVGPLTVAHLAASTVRVASITDA